VPRANRQLCVRHNAITLTILAHFEPPELSLVISGQGRPCVVQVILSFSTGSTPDLYLEPAVSKNDISRTAIRHTRLAETLGIGFRLRLKDFRALTTHGQCLPAPGMIGAGFLSFPSNTRLQPISSHCLEYGYRLESGSSSVRIVGSSGRVYELVS